jgi:uncharacterized protein
MTKMIFVNLPVAELATSKRFYEAIGFTNNPQFTDDTAACMVWSDSSRPRRSPMPGQPARY